MPDLYDPMDYYLNPRRIDSDWGYKILQVTVARPGMDVFVSGPRPDGNFMLVFSNREHKEELEVVIRADQVQDIRRAFTEMARGGEISDGRP